MTNRLLYNVLTRAEKCHGRVVAKAKSIMPQTINQELPSTLVIAPWHTIGTCMYSRAIYYVGKRCEHTHTHPHTPTHTDFVLTYQLQVDKKKKQDTQDKQDKRKAKREKFLESCREAGLEFEEQDASVSHLRVQIIVCSHKL